MVMRKKKQMAYEEYFINGDHIKKLYNMYIHQTPFDRVLDILVFFAIIFTAVALVLEFMHFAIDPIVLDFIHTVSGTILVIFIVELIREYAKSKTGREFLKKHWIDLILISILSFYFLFVTYFGIAKLKLLTSIKGYVQELKHIKVAFKLFKR